MLRQEVQHARSLTYEIDLLSLNRWSLGYMSGEERVDEDLMILLEAARRLFSSFNNQMLRFIYAKSNTEHWANLLDLLNEDNPLWTKDIATLVIVISRKTFEYDGRDHITYQFDTDTVWENLALEVSIPGIVTHSIEGLDYEKGRMQLAIPFICSVFMAMIAIRRRRSREMPPTALQGREFPDGIRPLLKVVMAVGGLKD